MSPPSGTTVQGPGRHSSIPEDHFSPKACANCHGSSPGPVPALSTTDYFAENPKKLAFLPSPSDCTAEIFWPDTLKTFQGFIQQNSFLKSQNYLETLLASRQGSFPLEITETSLGVYLGMKSGSSLPNIPKVPALELGRDATVCSGSLNPGLRGPEACQGLELEWQDGDALLPLEGLELISAQDLEVEAQGILGQLPGAQATGVVVQDGKLLLGIRLGNPFWNAAFPLGLPFNGVKITPNPFQPDLYDVDLTSLILKKLPVAYDLQNRKAVSFEEYQASAQKGDLKILPYFFNIARRGRLPKQLSLNEVYKTVGELRANTDPAEKKEDLPQRAILEKLFDRLLVSAQLHPRRLLHKNLYVEFSQDSENNLLRTDFSLDRLQDWKVLASAPIKIDRLFSPGLLDIVGMKADLGLILQRKDTSSLSLDQLEIELGRMEYLRADPEKPGMFALLGGRIRSEPDPVGDYYLQRPAFSIKGTEFGADVELNLRVEGLSLRLPQLGEVNLTGNLKGQVKLVPKVDGENTRWVIEPHSLYLAFSELELQTESGVRWHDAKLEITDQRPIGPILHSNDPGFLSFRFHFPTVEGGHFQSFAIEGGMPLAKGIDGLYDLDATLKAINTQFTLKALKHDGLPENWVLDLQGEHSTDKTHLNAHLDGIQLDALGKVKRKPIEDLTIKFDRSQLDGKHYFGLHVGADRVDFDRLDLRKIYVGINAIKEEPSFGVTQWNISELDFKANRSGWTNKGWVRGPIWLTSKASEKNPLFLEIDKNSKEVTLKNLSLSFGVTGLTDHKLASLTGNRIIGIDVDGKLLGKWKMNYETFKGTGLISLLGDGQGDVHLRGKDGMPLSKPHPDDPTLLVGTPVLSNTEWLVRRIDGIDFENKWIRGNFHLRTLIDPSVARVFGFIFDNNSVLSWQFNHDHLPYSSEGYARKMDQYLARKAAEERQEQKKKSGGTP